MIPIVAYLLWDRRDMLARATPIPNAWFALAAIPVVMVWLLAERLGIMEGRQLMVMTLVEIFFLSVLGWRLSYRLAGPLLYLYFLVPFGAFITPQLQGFTTNFIVHGLNLLNIPNYADGNAIEIPEGSFLVAEACAGLRFLIASVAFGYLYAMLMYRSPLRRGIFMLASIVVPIIANGFRALGIVVLGHILGNAQAAAADHLIYGWIFFSIVILLLIALGLPFRQDHRPAAAASAAPAPPRSPVRETSVRAEARGSRGVRRRQPAMAPACDDRVEVALGRRFAIRRPWRHRVRQRCSGLRLGRRRRHRDRGSRAGRRAGTQSRTRCGIARDVAADLLHRRLHHRSRPARRSSMTASAGSGSSTSSAARWHSRCASKCSRHARPPAASSPSCARCRANRMREVDNVIYLSTPEGPRTWRVLELR